MLEIFVKYGVLLYCSFYVLLKLLKIKTQTKIYLQYALLILIALPVVYILRLYNVSLSIIFLILFLSFFSVKVIKVSINLSLTTSIISFGISYLAFIISAAIISAFFTFLISPLFDKTIPEWIPNIFTTAMQLLLIVFLFKSKRLKNGIPLLIQHGSSDISVYISVTLFFAASFLGLNKDTGLVYLIPFFFAAISGLFVFFWWRSSITRKYLEKVKAQEIQALQEGVNQQEAEIRELKRHNNELSKIIHKDNKLIPALEYAVRQYLLTVESETDNAAQLVKGRALLSQIESASRERTGLITSYESDSKSLPKTGVPSVDSLLMYMFQKSKEQQIDFHFSLSGSVKYLVENIAAEQDINTLLADLIENAIIATKKCAPGNILAHIGIVENCYTIGIFDNGIPFTPETINDIGLKRTTTHAGEGGSGIGLVTTFEILKKYQASFVLEDISDNVLYTKNVSICFDRLGQFRIKSKHLNDFELYSAREDIVFLCDIGA